MPNGHPTISTHVLDTASGRPAPGIGVRCWRLGGDVPEAVGEGVTDADGRIRDLLGEAPLVSGVYRLSFDLDAGRFFATVTLEVRIDDPSRSHHVPLLLAPYGLTTYRGS